MFLSVEDTDDGVQQERYLAAAIPQQLPSPTPPQ
jgi:hypothetical protein